MINGSLEQQLLTMREAAKLLRCSKAHLSNVLNGRVRSLSGQGWTDRRSLADFSVLICPGFLERRI
jgi:hypothetical protein